MAESTETLEAGAERRQAPEEHVSEYTTQTGDNQQPKPAARKPVVTGTALGTGRRKEAIARVRIQPGTGQWKINDRSLEDLLPEQGAPAADQRAVRDAGR